MKKLLCCLLLFPATTLFAAEWPRALDSPEGLITIYEPQIDSYAGNSMKARMAISITTSEGTEPIFGAVWLDCHVLTDRQNREVMLQDVQVRQIRFPAGSNEETAKISASLEQEIPRWQLTFPLAELLESIETAQKERESAKELDDTPPQIIVMDRPAVLVLIDGDPIISDVPGSSLRRVENTPFFLVQDPSLGIFYLRGGDLWYSARAIAGPWLESGTPPPVVEQLSEQTNSDDSAVPDSTTNAVYSTTGKIPEIVVSTLPAELISSDGPLQYTPINGTGLLYASNTSSKLFMEIASQRYFLLISGRWYSASALTGNWTYVPSDKIPGDFAKIPPGTPCDDVLASVPGTLPAREAILDAQIPQTAEVNRADATTDVQYDGDPDFEPMEGTEMTYAVNTSTPVILYHGHYFVCDRGVWFDGPTAMGPWEVCVDVPDVIYTIPPSYPIYYVRYVRVYSYTPTVVYVGYTGGYTGCYVYNRVVVYGTGYRYHPWHRHYYYPRPWTWGFNVYYDPWTGWSMGFAGPWWHERGWFAYNRPNVQSGWWGPVGYRPLYRPHAGPEYRKGYHPVYRPVVWRTQPPAPSPGQKTRMFGVTRSTAIYDRWTAGVHRNTVPLAARGSEPVRKVTQAQGGKQEPVSIGAPTKQPVRAVQEPEVKREPTAITPPKQQPEEPVRTQVVQPAPRPVAKDNNVYTTPEGGILRQTPQGWQQRDQNTWKSAGKVPATSGATNDAQVRQRAAERTSSFSPPPPQQAQPAQRVQQREAPRPAPVQPRPNPAPSGKKQK